ncbi:MAG: hypothetical protein SVE93_08265 [Candidatus Thermoplasmatota archaeon]|nr:hypothetical protein [Candidatus Thermoplasmatota archaeon]
MHTLSLKTGVSSAFSQFSPVNWSIKHLELLGKKKSITVKPHKAAKPLKVAETQIITNKDAHIIHKTGLGRKHDLFKDKHPLSQS